MTFKALNGLAPPYIVKLIEAYQPALSLRSANENLLTPQSFKGINYGILRELPHHVGMALLTQQINSTTNKFN